MKYRYNPVYILLMVLSWAAFGFCMTYLLKFKQLSMDLCPHVLDRNPKAEISKKLIPHA